MKAIGNMLEDPEPFYLSFGVADGGNLRLSTSGHKFHVENYKLKCCHRISKVFKGGVAA